MRFLSRNILLNRYKSRYISRDISSLMGSNSNFSNARGARIIVYHGICLHDHLRFNTIFLTIKRFESHLKFYKKYFNVISLDEFYKGNFDNNKFNVSLTFDDGFANNHKYVLPLLEQYELSAAFFITAIREAGYGILWNDHLSIAYKYGPHKFIFRNQAFVKDHHGKYKSSTTGEFLSDTLRATGFEAKAELMQTLKLSKQVDSDYWLQMTEKQIKELSASKWVTIGSHGYYHNDLAKISPVSIKDELVRSKSFLENCTGKEIRTLAFPYGSYNEEVISKSKKAGYTQLLATEFLFPGDVNDQSLRERLIINPFISTVNQMHANINGKY